jgi:hypothetical protein
MLDIVYSTKSDYSALYPPQFVQISKVYNTILIPISDITEKIFPGTTVSFLYNKKIIKQKVGVDCGTIKFYNKEYYYFYIVPGFTQYSPDEIFINDKPIKLSKYFDPQYRSKILNGLIILPNNFNYLFNHTNYSILLTNNKNILTNIIKQENKYNYYMANANNTLLHILDPSNTNSLYELNSANTDSYIRPISNKNYPLGSCLISSEGVNNIRMKIGNNIFKFNSILNIDHLLAGRYSISFLDDQDNPISINTINGKLLNTTSFDIIIDKVTRTTTKGQTLQESAKFSTPKKDLSNLLINIYPYRTQFELFGPNNFYRKFNTGYQKLYNIESGNYNIKYKDINKEILVIKNDNNYFSNL